MRDAEWSVKEGSLTLKGAFVPYEEEFQLANGQVRNRMPKSGHRTDGRMKHRLSHEGGHRRTEFIYRCQH